MTWTTALVICLIVPFAGFFAYAAFHEYRRHRREGPVEDWREKFEFDEEAPGYEDPEEQAGAEEETDRGYTPPDATDPAQDRKG
ncbi:hypothetical protein SAMN05444722_0372 [Rhodovulum sp. ES.010]|uniref:hypothetical protein n=1 Tax=Rhodovulum sp. ES.010 TaxID=1882821 RepID=UPI00092B0F8B|nr:hypothetical protein [Rhodovulum sp. ES.010]SIO08822.1 hypothetical protein SAMN05444722_0372 [Rhodovulum sp. ES.010]